MTSTTYDDVRPGCYDPVARAEDMLSDGIGASVLFPTLPRFSGTLFLTFRDKVLAGRRLYFVGIGGSGMSAYANIAGALGAEVRGWDVREVPDAWPGTVADAIAGLVTG